MKRSSTTGTSNRFERDPSKVPRLNGSSSRNKISRSHKSDSRHKPSKIESLTDLAAKVTAAHIPFELVEERCSRVPEPVLLKLITWSFPRSEADIRRYSAIDAKTGQASEEKLHDSRSTPEEEALTDNLFSSPISDPLFCVRHEIDPENAFSDGERLVKRGAISQSIQIGFHLSGVVTDDESHHNVYSSHSSNPVSLRKTCKQFNVAVTFDRCKVTSSSCNCNSGSKIFFCRHVVAVLLHRIRHQSKVKIRVPISDSLQQLDRNQLQKLVQYLVARHSHILPTSQEIADLCCDPSSNINQLHGAPDPTAGASCGDDDRWSLDEQHVTEYIRNAISHSDKKFAIHCLNNILDKIRSMMAVRDGNGSWLLTLITRELLQGGLVLETCMFKGSYFNLLDDIGSLWVCTILDPRIGLEKMVFLGQLRAWNEDRLCSNENDDFPAVSSSNTIHNVLSRAITSGSMDWNDEHLKRILRGEEEYKDKSHQWIFESPLNKIVRKLDFNSKAQPLWWEATELACARIEVLRNHGYEAEAVRLALSVARTIKEESKKWLKLGRCQHEEEEASDENPLKPIIILHDTLSNKYSAAIEERLSGQKSCSLSQRNREIFEVCLLKLGQQKSMPSSSRLQEKLLSCERELITKLYSYSLSEDQVATLRRIATVLLDGGNGSGLGIRVPRDSVPTHSFAMYLVSSLLPHDRKLVFKIGIRSMRMPILDSPENQSPPTIYPVHFYNDDNINLHPCFQHFPNELERLVEPLYFNHGTPRPHYSMYPSNWQLIEHLESKQFDLSLQLIKAATGEVMLLKSIVEGIQCHMRNSSHVFRLSRIVFKDASDLNLTPDSSLLNVSMHLVMQTLRMTLQDTSGQRREMVSWLVTCATEIGLCALHTIIKDWNKLFTPVEACTVVAGCVISPNTAMRLNLDPMQREELHHTVCKMTVECARKDPQCCSLCSLTLCETCLSAFDEVYYIILEAAERRHIDSQQLYTIARYLDQRGLQPRAFAVAYRATTRLRVPFNYDAHPAASDLLWTTQLAQSLGLRELEELIMIIVNKVRCPSVLSDVLRTCTSSISGRLNNFMGAYANRGLRADRPPLRPLLEASIAAYISTIHSKLSHISPRHYNEFINFLNKARETFLLAPDGHFQFTRLLTNLKTIYKGKKKLLNLVALRFG